MNEFVRFPGSRRLVAKEGRRGRGHVIYFCARAQNVGELGPLADATVTQLGYTQGAINRNVVCVPASLPTLATFAAMHCAGVSSAGLVRDAVSATAQPLIGSVSASDFRGLSSSDEFVDAMLKPVEDFLAYTNGCGKDALPLVTVPPNATLTDVLKRITETKVATNTALALYLAGLHGSIIYIYSWFDFNRVVLSPQLPPN